MIETAAAPSPPLVVTGVERVAEPPARVDVASLTIDARVPVTPIEGAVVIEPLVVEPLAPEVLELELMEAPMPLRAEWVEIEPIVIE